MDSPCKAHGFLTYSSWISGVSLGILLCALPKDSVWIPNGLLMDALWIPDGLPMDSLRIPSGFLVDSPL